MKKSRSLKVIHTSTVKKRITFNMLQDRFHYNTETWYGSTRNPDISIHLLHDVVTSVIISDEQLSKIAHIENKRFKRWASGTF